MTNVVYSVWQIRVPEQTGQNSSLPINNNHISREGGIETSNDRKTPFIASDFKSIWIQRQMHKGHPQFHS